MQYRIEITGDAARQNGDVMPVPDRASVERVIAELVRTICPAWTLRTANLLMEDGTMVTITQEH